MTGTESLSHRATERVAAAEGELIDGRYRVGESLGEGAQGLVYAAHDVWLDREVAIKIVGGMRTSPEALERFQKEAQALARIRHANVVQIYAFGCRDDSYYFAMEYINGRDLGSLIEEAKARGTTVPHERALEIELSCRADIYALACTAFELLTGNLPFGGEDPVEIVRAHVQDEPPLVSAFQPDRAAFDGVIARGMAKNPLERYESCSAFVADLDLALASCRSRPVTSRPPFAPQRVLRVIVLAHDEALRGQLGRIVDRALAPLAVCAAIESVPTAIALAGAIARSIVDVVVLDDDSVTELQGNTQSPLALREFVAEVRRTGAEVVVLQRDVAECPLRFAELGVHVVPKPMSARLVESMITRLASDQRRTME